MHTIGEKRIRMLRPRDIKRPTEAVRTYIDQKELYLLRDSISASGVLQPILVRRIKKGKYQLISGNRRLNAAILAGLRRVPCVVHNADEKTALLYSLAENLQIRGLSFFDEAKAIKTLITQGKMTLNSVAIYLGVSQTQIADKLNLLRLDEKIARRITAAGLTEDHAKSLLRLPADIRGEVLDTVISKGYSPLQTEDYIFSVLNPPLKIMENEVKEEIPEEKPMRKSAIGDPRLFSNSIIKLVDTLKNSGVKVNFRKTENDSYIEYKVRIKKETAKDSEPLQLELIGS